MVVDEQTSAARGPLLEVLNEAAQSVGFDVRWRVVPFPRSLESLKTGEVDIVPRLVPTEERKVFAEYLGPIGVQHSHIEFLVKAGKESSLKTYDDLLKLKIGVKRKTAYFERFNKDTAIQRMEALDDENLAQMFDAGRFDAMIVLDKRAVELVLKKKAITGYGWADYKEPIHLGIFFGMSKLSRHAGAAEQLSAALRQMATSGRVAEIYRKAHLAPPPAE